MYGWFVMSEIFVRGSLKKDKIDSEFAISIANLNEFLNSKNEFTL